MGRGPADLVARRLPANLSGHVPRKYERLGDVVLMKLPKDPRLAREIGRAYATILDAKAVLADRGVTGPWRRPITDLVWGDRTETIHTEGGVRFKLDPAKVMFSSGNINERLRMATIATPGETVVDLFAGIGYYAIPMAVHGEPSRIVACEANPEAFRYLRENVRINRAERVEPVLGDCRDLSPPETADRIVMGYLHGEPFLDVAMRTARRTCTLHYHEATPRAEIPERPWARVRDVAREAGFLPELLAVRRVKSYAPRIDHVVLDVRLTR